MTVPPRRGRLSNSEGTGQRPNGFPERLIRVFQPFTDASKVEDPACVVLRLSPGSVVFSCVGTGAPQRPRLRPG
jgi:hypothetical protein